MATTFPAFTPVEVPHHPHVHGIGADPADPHWLGEVPEDRPAVIVADGLVAFLAQDVVAPCSTASARTSRAVNLRSTPTPGSTSGR